jgi:hypothetical protein
MLIGVVGVLALVALTSLLIGQRAPSPVPVRVSRRR